MNFMIFSLNFPTQDTLLNFQLLLVTRLYQFNLDINKIKRENKVMKSGEVAPFQTKSPTVI